MFYILLIAFIFILEWKIKNYIEAVYDSSKQELILKNKIRLKKISQPGSILEPYVKKEEITSSDFPGIYIGNLHFLFPYSFS